MKAEKLISVIIPVYQVERYFKRCVDSVIHQTYRNLEIILVDDGSHDSSGLLCDYYKEQDLRIKVIHQENAGLSVARNSGLEIATGSYVLFVDADDFIHHEMIQILYGELEKWNAKISMCLFYKFSGDGTEIVKKFHGKKNTGNRIQHITQKNAIKGLFNKNSYFMVTTCNKIYDRDLFEDTRFPKGRIHEDVATTYRLFSKVDDVVLVKEELYYYFQRSDSIMHKAMSFQKTDLFTTYDEMMDFFEYDKKIQEFIKHQYIKALKYYYASAMISWDINDSFRQNFFEYIDEKFLALTKRRLYGRDWKGYYVLIKAKRWIQSKRL